MKISRTRSFLLVGYVLVYAGTLGVVCGIAADLAWLVAAATSVFCLGLAVFDFRPGPVVRFSPLTLFALGSAITGFANAWGLRMADTPKRRLYFLYAADEHLMLAVCLALAGAVLPVLGFWIGRGRSISVLGRALPRVKGDISRRVLTWLGGIVGLSVVGLKAGSLLPSLGTFSDVIRQLPILIAFTLARYAGRDNSRSALVVAFAVAAAESVRCVLFAYLRSDMILPLFAFALGMLLGKRSLKPLRSMVFVPIYAAVAVFIVFFGTFGSTRENIGHGMERLSAVFSAHDARSGDAGSQETILSRSTSFNQLSQIGRIVDQDGFLDGATLSYLSYAFIPRFLWPEKPEIALGAWYASRIGQASMTSSGRYNNSINMTIAGELYLNFGWIGVLIGNLGLGVFFAFLWNTTQFWQDSRNALGSAFGFYLLYLGFASLGADLQIVVTVIATYLLFVCASWMHPRRQSPQGRRVARWAANTRIAVAAQQ